MIIVSPLSQVENVIADHGPSHLVSLLDPASMIETPRGIHSDNHLKLGINDIAVHDPELVTPGEEHVEQLIDFVRGWQRDAPILIHCWAGISRSSASALITGCVVNGPGCELELVTKLRQTSSMARPNNLLIAHADRLLNLGGKLVHAVDTVKSDGEFFAFENDVFTLPARV